MHYVLRSSKKKNIEKISIESTFDGKILVDVKPLRSLVCTFDGKILVNLKPLRPLVYTFDGKILVYVKPN